MDEPSTVRPRDDPMDWVEARQFLKTCLAAQLRSVDSFTLDDLTQEALVGLHRALRNGEAANLNGLMYEIARCTRISWQRRIIRERARWAPDHALDAAASPSRDGDALADALERFRFVVLEFFRVHDAPCRSLAESFFEEMDWHSVARRAGRAPTAVRKQWSRCIAKLREADRNNPGWLPDLRDVIDDR